MSATHDQKLKRISEIKSEVQELHPLLRALFPKLPNIENVEYTHGSDEKGADFILFKSDLTLNITEYIGVIVKAGNITQDHQDIKRQIEECEMERFVLSGKKKIHLNQIWILTNGRVSENAKAKINHSYKHQNIQFVNGEQLLTLIDKHYPDYWVDSSVETGEYLREVKKRADRIRHNAAIVVLGPECYVEPELDLISKNIKFSRKSKSKTYSPLSVLDKGGDILIEGEMGSGKSNILAQLAEHYCDPEIQVCEGMVPVLTTFKEVYLDPAAVLEEAINSALSSFNLGPDSAILCFIDAFDEVDLASADLLDTIRSILSVKKDYPNLRIVSAIRSVSDPGLASELDKLFTRFEIRPFSIGKITTLIRKVAYKHNLGSKIDRDLGRSQLFKALPKTPISAILLARILQEGIDEIPSTMTDLYAKYMELILGRWDVQKGESYQVEYDILNSCTVNLARYLIKNGLDRIGLREFKSQIADYISERNLPNDPEKIFALALSKPEIFVIDNDYMTVEFRHRTFCEFFYALSMDKYSDAAITEQMYSLYWSKSYFFYFGLKRDCPELLEALNSIELQDEELLMGKILNIGSFLLAAYLTPYDRIKDVTDKAFQEAASLFESVAFLENGESPLRRVPPLNVLCLVTKVLNDTFGYEHFVKALEDICVDVSRVSNPSRIDLVKFFLAASTVMAIDDKKQNYLEQMVGEFEKTIPLVLKLGIMHTAEDYRAKSRVLDRYSKQIIKKQKKNNNLELAVRSLYFEEAGKVVEVSASERI